MTEETIDKNELNTTPPKKIPLKLIIIAISVLVLIGGGIFGAMKFGLIGKKSIARHEGEEGNNPENAAVHGKIVGVDAFIVNLADSEANRYLKATAQFELKSPEFEKKIKESDPLIRDTILALLSSKTMDQIRDIKGKIKLRQEIIARVNEILGTQAITQVYFTEFIIQ